MNDNYQKNLRRFELFCPEAAKELEACDCSNLQFCQTEKGEINLKKELGTNVLYYHSQKAP